MKYILVIGDGMADAALVHLAGKTPLEALALPAFDRVAGCHAARVLTIPHGQPAGSDTAILSIFGYDPRIYYTGRSVLEAAGMGVEVPEGCLSFRINLCAVTQDDEDELVIRSHNGGGIHGAQALTLMKALTEEPSFAAKLKEVRLAIHITDTFRHIGVMQTEVKEMAAVRLTEPHNVLDQRIEAYLPVLETHTESDAVRKIGEDIKELMLLSYDILKDHPVNRERIAAGQLPANMIWPWGAATGMKLPSFAEKYGHFGSVVSAVPLVKGIASLAGLKTPHVPGANGELNTNYEGKVEAVIQALAEGEDFAAVHVEAPDEMAHAGDLAGKLEAIQNVESRVVYPILEKMTQSGEDFRLLLLSDHPTLLTTRGHDGSPVPYAIYDSRQVQRLLAGGKRAPVRKFCEREMSSEPVLMEGTELMGRLFEA